MGTSSFRLVRVGGGYAGMLWNVARARVIGSGPYAGLHGTARPPEPER